MLVLRVGETKPSLQDLYVNMENRVTSVKKGKKDLIKGDTSLPVYTIPGAKVVNFSSAWKQRMKEQLMKTRVPNSFA